MQFGVTVASGISNAATTFDTLEPSCELSFGPSLGVTKVTQDRAEGDLWFSLWLPVLSELRP